MDIFSPIFSHQWINNNNNNKKLCVLFKTQQKFMGVFMVISDDKSFTLALYLIFLYSLMMHWRVKREEESYFEKYKKEIEFDIYC